MNSNFNNSSSPRSGSQSSSSSLQSSGYLPGINKNDEAGFLRWKPLAWWLTLTLPSVPETQTSPARHNAYNRARTVSIMMLLLFIVLLVNLVPAIFSGSLFNIIVIFLPLVVIISVLFLNKAGYLATAGLLFVGLYTLGFVVSFALLPALDLVQVLVYYQLLISVLFSALFFPTWSVFVVALFNCIFIGVDFSLQKHTPTLDALVAKDSAFLFTALPIFLQVLVALLTYVLLENAKSARERANRAEELVRLQQTIAEQQQQAEAYNKQLESSVAQIVDTLTQYGNGNLQARVPLTRDNVLWHVAGAVNNLIGRNLRLRQEIDNLRDALARRAPMEGQPRTFYNDERF